MGYNDIIKTKHPKSKDNPIFANFSAILFYILGKLEKLNKNKRVLNFCNHRNQDKTRMSSQLPYSNLMLSGIIHDL